MDIESRGFWDEKGIVLKCENVPLRDHCAEDVWGLKVFCEQTFHMRIDVDHTV